MKHKKKYHDPNNIELLKEHNRFLKDVNELYKQQGDSFEELQKEVKEIKELLNDITKNYETKI